MAVRNRENDMHMKHPALAGMSPESAEAPQT
jgi:hypothetical protein